MKKSQRLAEEIARGLERRSRPSTKAIGVRMYNDLDREITTALRRAKYLVVREEHPAAKRSLQKVIRLLDDAQDTASVAYDETVEGRR